MSRASTRLLAAATLGCLALTACSAEDPGRSSEGLVDGSALALPDGLGSGTSPDPAPSAPPEPVEPVLSGPHVFPRLPAGRLRLIGSATDTDSDSYDGGVVFADDVVVMVPGGTRVHALDRRTGEELWSAKLPADRFDDTLCPTPPPPPGATAVVVVSGVSCGMLTAFDLRTGRQTLRVRSDVGLGFLATQGFAQVGDHTYWVNADSQVVRIQPDGSPRVVLTPGDLGVDRTTREIQTIFAVGTGDTLVVKTKDISRDLLDEGAFEDAIDTTDDGEFIGVRMTEESGDTRAEVVWKRPVRRALGDVVPQTTYLGTHQDPYAGTLYNTVMVRGVATPRIAQLDPATGAVGPQLVLRRDPPGGFPAWADPNALGGSLLVVGTDVLATATDRRGAESVVRYDLATGRIAWVWEPRGRFDSYDRGQARPVGMSDDGAYAYASVTSSFGLSELVEIAMDTGEVTETWRLPAKVTELFDSVDFSVDDGQVAIYDRYYDPQFSKRQLGLLDIG